MERGAALAQIPDGTPVAPLVAAPLTDKQRRHEQRLKRLEKAKRRAARTARGELEVVAPQFPQEVSHLSEEQLARQALIKAGLGKVEEEEGGELEVVKPPKAGSEEHLEALSLGFLLSKHSTANDLIDSSFNRYMFNDPAGLPQWFLDDEKKFNRPQLPMTKEIIAKLRKQFAPQDRTIKKEREAMARKKRRVERLRKQQKAKIDSINNDEDMPDSAKLRAIQKLMKGKALKRPRKVYVVGKKGRPGRSGHNVKMVDPRMKVSLGKRREGRKISAERSGQPFEQQGSFGRASMGRDSTGRNKAVSFMRLFGRNKKGYKSLRKSVHSELLPGAYFLKRALKMCDVFWFDALQVKRWDFSLQRNG